MIKCIKCLGNINKNAEWVIGYLLYIASEILPTISMTAMAVEYVLRKPNWLLIMTYDTLWLDHLTLD